MMLKVKNLNIYIKDKKILENVNLNLTEGFYVLKGPNGSGKTTFLSAIAGIPKYKIDGKIIFNNTDITNKSLTERARLGIILVPQHLPRKTNIKLRSFINALKEVWKSLDLDEKVRRFSEKYIYEEFSGGEAKIIDFVISISIKPKVLLIDEIDSGLDEYNIRFVAEMLDKIKDKTIILLTTHSEKILSYLKPKKTFLIRNGKVIELI